MIDCRICWHEMNGLCYCPDLQPEDKTLGHPVAAEQECLYYDGVDILEGMYHEKNSKTE